MLLKVLLTPLLILLCAGVTRRWGTFLSGAVAGLPLIAGPTSFFLTLEQGPAFAAAASYNTLLGVVSLAGRLGPALVWGFAPFAGGIFRHGLAGVGVAARAVAGGDFGAGHASGHSGPAAAAPHPLAARLRLPLQMAWGAALMLGVTAAAQRLSPG